MISNILNEHKVDSFDDFKSNYKQIQDIKNFLEPSSKDYICIISGCLCSGKSTILDILSKDDKYETLYLHSECNYVKELDNFTSKKSMQSLFFNKQRLILIDDIHMMEKSFITSLKKFSKEKILVTIQSKEDAKINEIRNAVKVKTLYVKLNKIKFQDCLIIVTELFDKLGIEMDYNKIVNVIKSNNNLRQILQLFENINDSDDKNNEVMKRSSKNINDMNIYDLTNYFIENKIDESYLSMNVSNIVLFILYENITKILNFKSAKNLKNNIEKYEKILDGIIVMNDDELQQDSYSSKIILEYKYMKEINNIILESFDEKDLALKFTNIFNKLSIQSMFNKKVQNKEDKSVFYSDPYKKALVDKNEEDFLYKKMRQDFK